MNKAATLSEIVDALHMQNDTISAVYDRETGTVIFLQEESTGEGMGLCECSPEDIEADMLTESKRYVPIPDQFEINDWRIMESFADSLSDGACAEVHDVLHARGAFRKFRSCCVERLGRLDDWYVFCEKRYEQIVIEWCEANEIPLFPPSPAP